LTSKDCHLSSLNIRDNLIREEAAEAIKFAMRENTTILRLQIDMNPIKHATIKEIEGSVKRNLTRYKERQGPAIRREVNAMYEER
jgi:hypothetical protein